MLGIEKLMKRKFKVFFNHTTNAGVTYYRMINFAKFMQRQRNVDVAYTKFNPNEKNIVPWEQKMDTDQQEKIVKDIDMLMEHSDISVWQMVHTGLSLALFNRCRDMWNNKKAMVMEIDDNVHAVNPESAAYSGYHNNSDLEYYAEMQMRNSNHMIVSTQFLADRYKKFCPCIEVIPNAIDFEIWNMKNQTKDGRVRIGWAGGQPHEKDLLILEKVIPPILEKYKNVEFMFYGHFPEFKELKPSRRVIHNTNWVNIYDYPSELAKLGFDIGLAPLRDNLFNRAKSNLRWLEYSALKIPTVASPVEPFKKSITHAGNGLLALETDEWIEQLSNLIENESLRTGMGKQAYRTVKQHYDAEKISLKYLKVLREISSGKREVNKTIYEEKDGTVFGRTDL